MTTKSPGRLATARWSKASIALCLATVGLLTYLMRSNGRADAVPLEEPVPATLARKLAFPELLEDERANLRSPVARRAGERRLAEDSRHAEPSPVHDDEMAYYLGTFLGESPDVLGWISCLGTLAASAEIDRGSLSEQGGVLTGDFAVPGSDARGSFSIEDEGCSITVTNGATLRVLGIESTASLSFEAVDGGIARAYGVVQFFPPEGQHDYEDGPVGYIYGTNGEKTLFRSIRQDLRNGMSRIAVTPPSEDQRLESGDLGPAYRWLERLQEVERSRAR